MFDLDKLGQLNNFRHKLGEEYFLRIRALFSMSPDRITFLYTYILCMYWPSLYLIVYGLRHLRLSQSWRGLLFLEYFLLMTLLDIRSGFCYSFCQRAIYLQLIFLSLCILDKVVLRLNTSFSKSKSLVVLDVTEIELSTIDALREPARSLPKAAGTGVPIPAPYVYSFSRLSWWFYVLVFS